MDNTFDIAIIGGGCAGLTAAIYAARAGKSVIVLEKETFGGQIAYSPKVENFPGFKSISGLDFSDRLFEQALGFGVKLELEDVLKIDDEGKCKVITTDFNKYTCKALILAMGLKHRKLGLSNEEKFIGNGISFCAMCDGDFFRGKHVAICGGGSAAMEDALFLAQICQEVTLIHRRESFRGENALLERLKNTKNINFALESIVTEIIEENGSFSGVKLKNLKTSEISPLYVSGLFEAIGREPETKLLAGFIKTDENGYILTKEDLSTNIPGIFAAGDCREKKIRQLTTAASDGAIAGISASQYIDALN